ncbi:MAG: hypothetical protein RSE00_04830 [Clostridia bacterium]
MENLILQVINILIQTAINAYFTIILVQGIDRKKLTRKEILIHTTIIFIGIALGTYCKGYYNVLSILICTLSLITTLLFVLKEKLLKTFFILLLNFALLSTTETIGVYTAMSIFKVNMYTLLASYQATLFIIIIQAILAFTIIEFTHLIFKKKVSIKETFKNITAKQIKIFIIAITIYVIPQLVIFIIQHYSYPVIFLVINSIQFICISIFLVIYIKKDIEHEKAQSDLFTSELHNKTMVGMVDGVRTLKHDYNNIMQALNRICFY